METNTTLSAAVSATGLLRLLGTLLSDKTPPVEKKQILRDEYEIPMTMTVEKEVSQMCNLSDGVWERAWNEAWNEAWPQAIEKGQVKMMLSNLQTMMQNTGWTAEKCMEILNVPLNSRQEYAEKLKQMDQA